MRTARTAGHVRSARDCLTHHPISEGDPPTGIDKDDVFDVIKRMESWGLVFGVTDVRPVTSGNRGGQRQKSPLCNRRTRRPDAGPYRWATSRRERRMVGKFSASKLSVRRGPGAAAARLLSKNKQRTRRTRRPDARISIAGCSVVEYVGAAGDLGAHGETGLAASP